MMKARQIEKQLLVPYQHRVYFTQDVFEPENTLLASLLTESTEGEATRVYVAVDEQLREHDSAFQDKVHAYFNNFREKIDCCGYSEYPGGEILKNDLRYLKDLYHEIEQAKLCRHSYLIGIGGGALLDMTGFAAATAHRGIRHLRLPTTSLSQGDGGVGVKNGVNYLGKKNFIGTFMPPHAVVNDLNFLKTLSNNQMRDGYIEAVKVALIRDGAFFDLIESRAELLINRDPDTISWIIEKSAQHHVDHIAQSGDPFELKSARPLDFGHWVAHKLETMSAFKISHGEAVAIGMAVDVLYSQKIGHLAKKQASRIINLIEQLGFKTYSPELLTVSEQGRNLILEGLDEFREHLGGQLTISLLNDIGDSFETHEMIPKVILECIEGLRDRNASRPHPES
ncbi:3-dehydroquinate synthase [Rubellicoccus peritrichatus]|uniref:3-dehydroquinate synthase n=1 Tax=Rubellicoccus peritrichatus TaxID=3080537 RepID=A0AAQ3QVD7_9BACT|nr:3-dehydroquinate synthase [Puniceicoccus sp. CR14]WOO41493.1 3-dehydroquinate synthase [Puniceicoccus sp. CR14]